MQSAVFGNYNLGTKSLVLSWSDFVTLADDIYKLAFF